MSDVNVDHGKYNSYKFWSFEKKVFNKRFIYKTEIVYA